MNAFHDPTLDHLYHDNPFISYGEYHHQTVATHNLVDEKDCFDSITYSDSIELDDDLLDSVNP
jgi:hypothetical protein